MSLVIKSKVPPFLFIFVITFSQIRNIRVQINHCISVHQDGTGPKFSGKYYKHYKWDSDPDGSDPFDSCYYFWYHFNCNWPPKNYQLYGNKIGAHVLLHTGYTKANLWKSNMFSPLMTLPSKYDQTHWYRVFASIESPAKSTEQHLYSCFYNSKLQFQSSRLSILLEWKLLFI